MTSPLKHISLLLIVDLIELVAVIAVLALLQLQYYPVIVVADALSLLFRIIGQANLALCNRSCTQKSLQWMRLTSLIIQIIGFFLQILHQWYYITNEYENLNNKNCVFCSSPNSCVSDYKNNFSYSSYENVVFSQNYVSISDYAHRGVSQTKCMILQSVIQAFIFFPYLLFQIHYILVARNYYLIENLMSKIQTVEVSELATRQLNRDGL